MFSRKLKKTRPKPLSAHSAHALASEICPVGKWRFAVRGFSLSNSRSTIRLNAIAQVRAQSIAARIRPNVRQPGQPRWSRAATTMDANANGSAKMVWEKRTKDSHLLMKENIEHRTSNAEHRSFSRLGRKVRAGAWPLVLSQRSVGRFGCWT